MIALRRQTRSALYLMAFAGVLILVGLNRMTAAGAPSSEKASEPFSPNTFLSSQETPSPSKEIVSQPPPEADFRSDPKGSMAYLDGIVERTGANYSLLSQEEKDWLDSVSQGNAERVFRGKAEEFRMKAAFEARREAAGGAERPNEATD